MTKVTQGPADLSGLRVLVTRPSGQSEALCRLIEQAGGQAIALPSLEIVAIEPDWVRGGPASLDDFSWLVFISANAVRFGYSAIMGHYGSWPTRPRVVAIGQATAAGLAERGVRVDLCPGSVSDSESLLAAPELAGLAGQKILIIRGLGGRALLAEGLRAQGATVGYLEVYARRSPPDCARRLSLLAADRSVDVVTATSGEALENLVGAGREAACLSWLLSLPLVVIGPRIVTLARDLGFGGPVMVAAEMTDLGFILTLKGCYSKGPLMHPG